MSINITELRFGRMGSTPVTEQTHVYLTELTASRLINFRRLHPTVPRQVAIDAQYIMITFLPSIPLNTSARLWLVSDSC